MRWQEFQAVKKYEKKLLYNSATGASNDSSTDKTNVDPNNYLVPRIDRLKFYLDLTLTCLLLYFIIKKGI